MIDLKKPMAEATSEGAAQPTVSIALATYNGERFLLEQLESLSRQTVLPDELVVSDDGSTDGTLEIVRSFALSAPFEVRILANSERLGYRKNFLRAAEACRCEIIFFCDQDDIWDDLKILRMRRIFSNHKTMMAYHQVQLIDEFGSPIGSFYQAFPHNPWRTIFGMSMAFRRCLLVRTELASLSIDFNWPEFNLAHDQWVTLLALAFGQVAVVDETLIGYRQHPGNVYGAGRHQASFVNRIRTRIKDRADAFEQLIENCKAIQKVFGELARDPDLMTDWRERSQLAEKTFEELGFLYERRSKIYKSPSLAGRLLSYVEFARLGAYRRAGYWTFGVRGAIRDLLFGVLFAPLITEFGCQKALGDADLIRLF